MLFTIRHLLQCAILKDRFVVMDVHGDSFRCPIPELTFWQLSANFGTAELATNNLKYGAAYAPNLETDPRFCH